MAMDRTLMRGVAGVGEARAALPTRHPFVARRSAHAVSLAELGPRPVSALEVAHEARTFVRQTRFHPRHLLGVNDPAGLASTITPVYTRHPLTPRAGVESRFARPRA